MSVASQIPPATVVQILHPRFASEGRLNNGTDALRLIIFCSTRVTVRLLDARR